MNARSRPGVWLVLLAALACLAAACGGSGRARSAATPQTKPCTVEQLTARCGTFVVPEDRLTGKGRTISLRFVVIPATGADRAADPMVYFAGGPGNSTVAEIPNELPELADLNVHRDLAFIEQRGTGESNPLSCPAFPGPGSDPAALRSSVTSCLAQLKGDLRFYTTAMYADDVDQLLTELHYGKVDLMGVSYGTAVEQVFLLRHPGRVRTMTLQSGSPLDVQVIERAPGNSQRALDYVFARCAGEPACHRAFPNPSAEWAGLWASLGTSPWLIPAAQSPTGAAQRFDQDALANAIYQAIYGYQQKLLPVAVHTLATATDKAAALAAVSKAGQPSAVPSDGPNLMMPYAITCAEPWASDRPDALADQRGSFAYHLDLLQAQWWQVVCPLIPKSAAAVGDLRPKMSPVPLLAFNGAGDPIEQPVNWAGAQRLYPNGREIVLPGHGHDVDSDNWQICAGPIQPEVRRASRPDRPEHELPGRDRAAVRADPALTTAPGFSGPPAEPDLASWRTEILQPYRQN